MYDTILATFDAQTDVIKLAIVDVFAVVAGVMVYWVGAKLIRRAIRSA